MKLKKSGLLLTLIAANIGFAYAQNTQKLKVGLMLPYSGTYASLGNAIENGFQLYVKEQGGKIGGRDKIGRAHV